MIALLFLMIEISLLLPLSEGNFNTLQTTLQKVTVAVAVPVPPEGATIFTNGSIYTLI